MRAAPATGRKYQVARRARGRLFELGPPFGPPSDAAFQRRVSLEVLGLLLDRRGGPYGSRIFRRRIGASSRRGRASAPLSAAGPALGDRLVAEIDALNR